jgi:SAM-dependent methyltransferase
MRVKEHLYHIIAKTGTSLCTKIFPEYFAKEPLAPSDRYLEVPFAIRNLPKPPARVLDVGCSGSFFALLLAGFGYDTYGIDIRNYPILNKVTFDNFTFMKCDIRKISFSDNFFDAITAISTIEHIGVSGRYGMNVEGHQAGRGRALDIPVRQSEDNQTLQQSLRQFSGKRTYERIYDRKRRVLYAGLAQ